MKDRKLRLMPELDQLEDINLDLKAAINKKKCDLFTANTNILIPKGDRKWSKKPSLKNYHCKTQAIERQNKYQLPQITFLKNPLIEMKFNQVQRSSKLIRNSNKNTKMLSQLIQILRDSSPPQPSINAPKKQFEQSKKPSQLQYTASNEFLQNPLNPFCMKKHTPTFQRGPKIINPQFLKICDNRFAISRRNIYSEERTRTRTRTIGNGEKGNGEGGKKSGSFNFQVQDKEKREFGDGKQGGNANLLTFYQGGKVNGQKNQGIGQRKIYSNSQPFKDINRQDFIIQI